MIGLSTLKLITKNVTGIGFALSSNDLVAVLRRFYPDLAPAPTTTATTATELSHDLSTTEVSSPPSSPNALPLPSATDGFGVVTISSDPDAAEIYVDGKFVGDRPATLKLSTGQHTVLLKSKGFQDYSRTLEMPRSSKLTLKAGLGAQRDP